jgi:hemerythrin
MAIHHQVIIKLNAKEYAQISKEHKELETYLKQLRDVCDFSKEQNLAHCENCTEAKLASCKGLLPSYLHDLHEVTFQHFKSEEKILTKKEAKEVFLAHKNSHELVLEHIDKLIVASVSNSKKVDPAKIYKDVYERTVKLFTAHEEIFDINFVAMPLKNI